MAARLAMVARRLHARQCWPLCPPLQLPRVTPWRHRALHRVTRPLRLSPRCERVHTPIACRMALRLRPRAETQRRWRRRPKRRQRSWPPLPMRSSCARGLTAPLRLVRIRRGLRRRRRRALRARLLWPRPPSARASPRLPPRRPSQRRRARRGSRPLTQGARRCRSGATVGECAVTHLAAVSSHRQWHWYSLRAPRRQRMAAA